MHRRFCRRGPQAGGRAVRLETTALGSFASRTRGVPLSRAAGSAAAAAMIWRLGPTAMPNKTAAYAAVFLVAGSVRISSAPSANFQGQRHSADTIPPWRLVEGFDATGSVSTGSLWPPPPSRHLRDGRRRGTREALGRISRRGGWGRALMRPVRCLPERYGRHRRRGT